MIPRFAWRNWPLAAKFTAIIAGVVILAASITTQLAIYREQRSFQDDLQQQSEMLLDFVNEIHFDRVGVFRYSFEPGTTSEQLGDPIPEQVKFDREERLMIAQQEISLARNQAQIGKVLDVLIEGKGEVQGSGEMISLGRSYRDAPEIDGMVIVEGDLSEGSIHPVQITGAMVYDLSGVPMHD